MRIRTVAVRRLKNLGNYENLTVELTAELQQGEKAGKVLHDLDNLCRQHLGQISIEEEQARLAERDARDLRVQRERDRMARERAEAQNSDGPPF